MVKKALLLALTAIMLTASPVLAISNPDSTPVVEDVFIYRNLLETGDWLIVVYENTPYASVPTDFTYPQAFIWRLIDTDGTTELAQALGYTYNDDGYGWNVIGFYLNASNVTALGLSWGDALSLRLSGTPAAFASPPTYTYNIPSSAYTSLTTAADNRASLAAQILLIAASLDVNWGLSATTSLLADYETGSFLSIYGQAFFRGAIYGIQGLAPAAFPVVIENINTDPRLFSDNYSAALAAQLAGQSLGNAFAAGEDFLDVDYNLLGLIILMAICFGLIIANWMIGGGNLWKGLVDSGAALVILPFMGVIGLGVTGLIAAVCWIYNSLKWWRMI